MLQKVFDEACLDAGISKSSRQAEGLAATLLELFQDGIRDEELLSDLLVSIEFL